MMTSWEDWPAVERQPGVEMNETFHRKWGGRHKALRARTKQVIPISGTITVFATFIDLPATSRIWIPPWASFLVMNVSIALHLALNGSGGDLHVRSRIGTSFGQDLVITEPPYTPGTSSDGQLQNRTLVHDVSGITDIEDVFTYQMKRAGFPLTGDVLGADIVPRDPWYWVEFLP